MNYRKQVLATWDPTLTDEERYVRAFTSLAVYASTSEDLAYNVVNDGEIMDIEELTENLAKVRYSLESLLALYGIPMQELEDKSIQLQMKGGVLNV
jgi:hypothetical protein